LIKRTSINYINSLLKKNPDWKILDIGCGYTANPNATTVADEQDFSDTYKDKKFIQITEKKLPFKDKEFDFVISSHVIEHVEDFPFFIKELERVSAQGYIELPTRLGDNLVFENSTDHIWWFKFDDTENKLIGSKRNQLLEPFISVATSRKLDNFFRESMVLELFWTNKIDYKYDCLLQNVEADKISFYKIIKKYFSKRIRRLIK
jgi:SAM-dependent methyltransferase